MSSAAGTARLAIKDEEDAARAISPAPAANADGFGGRLFVENCRHVRIAFAIADPG
jgi:hypothetical protein